MKLVADEMACSELCRHFKGDYGLIVRFSEEPILISNVFFDNMKQILLFSTLFSLLLISSVLGDQPKVQDAVAPTLQPGIAENTQLGGHLGDRLNACIQVRVIGQDVDELIAPFNNKTETRRWQSEFWGKWMLGAVLSYRNCQDPKLLEKIKHGVDGLLASQSPNGYIGNYAPEAQLQQWDIWGRKYSMLGLLSYYDLTGEARVLEAVQRVADHLMTQIGPGKTDIALTGNYYGMASCSVLEPIIFLYRRTGEQKYLDFAKYIIDRLESENGPGLIAKAEAGVDVADRFPHPVVVLKKGWWSRENGQKAYEMMSCYEGILEMYRITGEKKYLDAVEKTVANIIETEINVAGSGASFECWYHGCACQTHPAYHTMETCVTMTWMKLCQTLLAVTGNPVYAEQIEKTAYNAMLASMKQDASEIAKYSPLEGRRHPGERQCGMNMNCCNANGPRAFALLPQVAVMPSADKDALTINLYTNLESEQILSSGKKVRLKIETNYPAEGLVRIEILQTDAEKPFAIRLRVPQWSAISTLKTPQDDTEKNISAGYAEAVGSWKKGDQILLNLDLRARVVRQNGFFALVKGPVVLARNSLFQDGFVDDCATISDRNGYVELTPVKEVPAGVWFAYTAPLVLGTDLEGEAREPKKIHFCDFASAGNDWSEAVRYRVWIPETLNVQKTDYRPY